jgi:Fic family protein
MPFDPQTPYNDLPLLPPPGEMETRAVLKKAIAANKALAELKGAGELIPDQSLLIQAIGLQEAKLSSEIENIVTTNDELYRAFADQGQRTNPHTKEVLRYKDALWHGYKMIKEENRPLTTRLFEELFQIIKETTAGVRRTPGTKLANSLGEVIYTPPEGETIIRDKLANLERFIYDDSEIDPLIKLAVMHYQFEAIHPFTDGNGRTGRIINILYLIETGLLNIPVLYLSRYIIDHKSAYYAGLKQITRDHAWEPWIIYMLDAITQTARTTHERIIGIRNLMRDSMEQVKKQLPKVYSKDLMELLFRQPYCKIRFLEQAGIAQRKTASQYLRELERIGMLTPVKAGREVYYLNTVLLKLLVS